MRDAQPAAPLLVRAGVRLEGDHADVRAVHMGVELRGGDARVPQQLLHDAQVGTALQQVRGKGMAQGVGMQPLATGIDAAILLAYVCADADALSI